MGLPAIPPGCGAGSLGHWASHRLAVIILQGNTGGMSGPQPCVGIDRAVLQRFTRAWMIANHICIPFSGKRTLAVGESDMECSQASSQGLRCLGQHCDQHEVDIELWEL